MIQIEYPYNNNYDLIRHYSDSGFMIGQVETGYLYEEAVDRYPCKFTYVETDKAIDIYEENFSENN